MILKTLIGQLVMTVLLIIGIASSLLPISWWWCLWFQFLFWAFVCMVLGAGLIFTQCYKAYKARKKYNSDWDDIYK